ncbi:ABC transporter substrate-binding protein [Halovenus sp. WSH3]|uniref:ABC transporter substrate-binding protein n=1 Tax=Halovenus carboxidivorans TaxID=2692199 RepID=A0A6B0SXJ4_9EURY|nr:ABC transporter substrate-binding protein [Halovenus carboxidivorans]MXR50065.1 ABC transporter substrate-binding protein [Halovenus carboxidivorans]
MRRKPKRREVLAGMGAASTLALAGCTGGDSSSSTTIELGLLMGITGGLEELGPPIRGGAETVPGLINDADNDWEVDTAFEDTETSPESGINGAQALVDSGYPMFVGALASDVSLPVARDVTLEEGVIQMTPASTAVEYSTLDEDIDGNLLWRTTPSDAFQGTVAAQIARNDIGANSVSTIARDDAYGRGLAEQFVQSFTDDGGTVQERLLIDPTQDSYTSQLQQALSGNPDMLYIVGFPEEGQVIFRDFYQEFDQPNLPILVPDGLQSATLPVNSGQDVETFSNVRGTGPGISDDVASGLDAYQQQVDQDGIFVREAYDAAAVLCLAYAAADGDDPNAIRAEISGVAAPGGETVTAENLVEGVEMAGNGDEIEYRGVSRPIEFDENGDVATPVYEYFRWTTDENGDPALESLRTITG